MLRSGEDADKSAKHQLEASLCVLWRKLRDGGRFSDDELQLGHDINHKPSVRAQCLQKGLAPDAQLGFGLAQQWTDKALKCLRQGGVGNVALVLVELARREQDARRNKQLVQLVHHRGFTDARITAHKHELWPTLRHDPVEGRKQCAYLALSTIQLLGNQQPVWKVLLAKREFVDVVLRPPLAKTTPKITLQAGCSLVSLLSGFGEQLHDDGRNGARYIWHALGGRNWQSCNMTVHPVHRIRSEEGEIPGQHLVKRNAQRVEVTAGINGAIHSPGLFGRHVGQGSGDELGGPGGLPLARKRRGYSKTREPSMTGRGVDKDIRGFQIFVDHRPIV